MTFKDQSKINACDFPKTASDMSLEWLNKAFKDCGHITNDCIIHFTIEPLGMGGYTSLVYLLELEYSNNSQQLPEKFVLKLASDTDALRALFAQTLQYRAEVGFYKTVDHSTQIFVPRCYVAEINNSNDYFILILELVTEAETAAPFQSDMNHINKVIHQIALLHSKWWNKTGDFTDFAQLYSQEDNQRKIQGIKNGINFAYKHHIDVFGDHFLLFMDRIIEHFDEISELVLRSPQTLIHGDFHPQQILVPHNPEKDFYFIDWQYAAISTACTDLSRYIVNAMFSDVRREIAHQVVDNYYNVLCQMLLKQGVVDYSYDQFIYDFKLSLLYTVCMHIALLPALDIESIGAGIEAYTDKDLNWYDLVFARQIEAISDFKLIELLNAEFPGKFEGLILDHDTAAYG